MSKHGLFVVPCKRKAVVVCSFKVTLLQPHYHAIFKFYRHRVNAVLEDKIGKGLFIPSSSHVINLLIKRLLISLALFSNIRIFRAMNSRAMSAKNSIILKLPKSMVTSLEMGKTNLIRSGLILYVREMMR